MLDETKDFQKIYIRLKEFNDSFNLIFSSDRLLLGLSGGMDSVFLATLLTYYQKECPFFLCAIYVDHHLRPPNEVEEDKKVVQECCKKNHIPLFMEEIDILENEKGTNVEAFARKKRYEIFHFYQKKYQLNKIVTAHHLDDLIETFLMRIFQGVGLDHLFGLQLKTNTIIRPLLFCEKAQIKKLCQNLKLNYHEDITNTNTKYLRNYTRYRIIPTILKRFPAMKKKLLELFMVYQEEQNFFDNQLENMLYLLKEEDGKWKIFLDDLHHYPITLQRRFLRKFLYEKLDVEYLPSMALLSRFLKVEKEGSYFLGKQGNYLVYLSYHYLVFILDNDKIKKKDTLTYIQVNKELSFLDYHIKIKTLKDLNTSVYSSKETAFFTVDKEKKFIFRRPKKGDKVLFGYGSKKIQDLLVDYKVPLYDREKVVVLESNKEIICCIIPNLNIIVAKPFFIKKHTTNIYSLEIKRI